jgi:hypothetical protein
MPTSFSTLPECDLEFHDVAKRHQNATITLYAMSRAFIRNAALIGKGNASRDGIGSAVIAKASPLLSFTFTRTRFLKWVVFRGERCVRRLVHRGLIVSGIGIPRHLLAHANL